MNKKDLKRFIDLNLLINENTFSIYGQEIIDNFVNNLITTLKKEGFKHYNIDYKKENFQGRFYKLNDYYFEIFSSVKENNNEALDIYYIFSRFIKNILGISIYEGYNDYHNNRYYYGYYIKNLFKVKQNKKIVYLKFDLRNIFYSVYNEEDYFSYLINENVYLIPLHQNKSGVLSYANKIKEKFKVNVIIDSDNISPFEKKKNAINKRIGTIIYVGPKELKHQTVLIEQDDIKETVNINDLDIDYYLNKGYKNKLNKSLKETFLNEKEIVDLNNLKYFNKVNLCENCNVLNYKKYMLPFNRVTKTNNCLICKKESKNLVFIKKRV